MTICPSSEDDGYPSESTLQRDYEEQQEWNEAESRHDADEAVKRIEKDNARKIKMMEDA